MTNPFQRLRRFLAELKRRNVYQVAATYAVVGFVLIQVADLTFLRLGLPSWTVTLVIVLVAMGFPLALVLAWAFERTPEGMRRTPDIDTTQEEAGEPGKDVATGYKLLVGLGLVAAAVVGGWYLTGSGEGDPSAGSVSSADSAVVTERSIAVLPFAVLSEGEESETFARGIHDDLLTRLAHISELTVISRTAVQQYQDTELTTGAIADSLGVRWVMEGGVQLMGDQIQVNAQLINPRTEAHSWADSYRRDLTTEDLFSLQGEITRRIARSLEARLTPEERNQVKRQPTEDLQAYRLYVRGRDRLDIRSEAGLRDAVDFFRQAIERDSAYALAWAGLADAIGLFESKEYATPEDSLPDHGIVARRALKLGPGLAEARASMGLFLMHRQNGPAALRELKRAVDLKPSYAQAHHWLGLLLFEFGRLEAARERVSLALELNPQHAAARGVYVLILVAQGRVQEASIQRKRHLRQGPPNSWLKGLVQYHSDRWNDLERLTRKGLSKAQGPAASWRFYLARIALLRGDTANAREHLTEVQEAGLPYIAALIHAALGDEEAAFSSWRDVQDFYRAAGRPIRFYYSDVLGSVRDDPRYRDLIGRINQEWGLNPDGSLPDSVDVSFGAESDE